MATLSNQWLTEGWIDFELKKYQLLAFLQDVSERFKEKKLYPRLSELITHYENLKIFNEQKKVVAANFPKQISRLDFENFQLQYQSLLEDDDLMREISEITSFALPKIEHKIEEGKNLYELVVEQSAIFPVGIMPLRKDEGYLFLSDFLQKLISVYYYEITLFEGSKELYRGIKTRHIRNYSLSINYNYEHIRYELIENKNELPNPATYVVEFKNSFPLKETMLPIAKRSLVRALAKEK